MSRMGEVLLRAADMADLDRLVKLAGTCPGAPQWSRTTWAEVLDSTKQEERRNVLMAESGGKLWGFGVVGIAADQAEIESLAVDADARRQGMGRRLCEGLMRWAGMRGASRVFLEVRMSNQAALALYETLGFREAAVRKAYYREPIEDGIVMARKL